MMNYSVVIEFSDASDGEDISARRIESGIAQTIQKFCREHDLTVIHLESSEGSLVDAFGVGRTATRRGGRNG